MIGYFIYAGLSAASPFIGRAKAFLWSFAAFLVFFISFRFETGFDWPVYKMLFGELQSRFTGLNASCFAENYNQEIVFIGLLGGLSQLFADYEIPQAIFSLFFLASVFMIGRAFKIQNISLFSALSLSYLVLTVGFSTVRQSIAIAAFNFAVILYLNRRHYACAALMVLSMLFQYSAAMYVFAFVVAIVTTRPYRSAWFDVAVFSILAGGALVGSALFLLLAKMGVIFGGERVAYYVHLYSMRGVNLWDVLFTLVLLGIAGHAIYSVLRFERDDSEILVSRTMLILAAFAVGALLIPVVRERASYEMWVLYSVMLCIRITALRKLAISGAFAFAACYGVLVGFRGPAVLMFNPYQNYFIEKLSNSKYPPRPYKEFITAAENNLNGHRREEKAGGAQAEQQKAPEVPQEAPRRRAC